MKAESVSFPTVFPSSSEAFTTPGYGPVLPFHISVVSRRPVLGTEVRSPRAGKNYEVVLRSFLAKEGEPLRQVGRAGTTRTDGRRACSGPPRRSDLGKAPAAREATLPPSGSGCGHGGAVLAVKETAGGRSKGLVGKKEEPRMLWSREEARRWWPFPLRGNAGAQPMATRRLLSSACGWGRNVCLCLVLCLIKGGLRLEKAAREELTVLR